MKRPAIFSALLFTVLIFCYTMACAAEVWPLKIEKDLSSGFGDFRKGRFHAGIDLRTGGVQGKELFSPVAGYVYKIRMSYYGYGKGLYVKGDDGYIYVFGHLSGFTPELDRLVKSRQVAQKRYFVDIDFPADSARVRQGQLLGYTGQTGVGAPHLHLEKRTPNNFPLNPLTHGFPVPDKVKPLFARIGFQMTDDHSVFRTAQRKMFLDIPASTMGKYKLDTVLYFSAPFGVLADCFDRMKDGGMRQAVYKLSLFVDDVPYYQVTMDTINYETGKAADLIYDYEEANDGEPRVRRLFHRIGNDYEGTHTYGKHLGLVGLESSFAIGRHVGRIVAEDAVGNKSELTFRFIWGPDNVYGLDSAVVTSDTTKLFYFTGIPELQKLGVISTKVYLNKGSGWGIPPSIKVEQVAGRKLRASVRGTFIHTLTLSLVSTTKDSCVMVDAPFNGIMKQEFKPATVHHDVSEDGLLVWADQEARISYAPQVELYFRDSLLGIERLSRFITMARYTFFIPPKPEYRKIDKIVVRMTDDMSMPENVEEGLMIFQFGSSDSVTMSADQFFSMRVDSGTFYEPRFIELKKSVIGNRNDLSLNSEHYQIFPESVLLKGDFRITLMADSRLSWLDKTALYRLDKEENRWAWMTSTREGDTLFSGSTRSGGSFALVYDLDPPVLSDLNIAANSVVRDLSPSIHFTLKDALSGIEDDRNFVIKLDGKWQIPEYDAETGICQVSLVEPLTPGDHHLSIEVTDRVGNEAHQYLQFKVSAPLPQRKGS